MHWRGLAFAVGILAFALPSASIRAQSSASEGSITALHSVRAMISGATEENIKILHSLRFNIFLAAVCINDINGIQNELEEQLARVEILAGLSSKGTANDSIVAILVKTDTAVAIDGLDLKRQRIGLNMRVCGTIPIVVSRAQLALSMLSQAKTALARFE